MVPLLPASTLWPPAAQYAAAGGTKGADGCRDGEGWAGGRISGEMELIWLEAS